MELLQNWCALNKLKVSSKKTQVMLMKGKFNKDRMPRIKINDVNVKYTDLYKYLGIMIDPGLSFEPHVRSMRQKIVKYGMAIKRQANEEWGFKNSILHVLYKTVVVPIMTYGSAIWYEKSERDVIRQHLFAAQRIFLLALTVEPFLLRHCRCSGVCCRRIWRYVGLL